MLAPLRHPTYRKLFLAQVVALVGTGLLTVALSLQAYDFAGSHAGTVLGTALTIKILMYVFAAPIMSAVVQRLPVVAVLVGADALRIAVALLLPWVDNTASLYAAIAILQLASATFTPTFQALIPRIITAEDDYTAALSLSRLAYDLEAVASPVFAAGALLIMSYHGLFIGTAGGFLGSLVLVLLAAPGFPASYADQDQESLLKRSLRGVRYMGRVPELRSVVFLNLAIAAPMAMVLVNTVVILRDMFSRDDAAVAWLLAAFGVGSMALAFSLPRLCERFSDFSLMWSGAAASISGMVLLYLVLISGWEWALWAIWPLLGAALAIMQTPISQVLRTHTPEADLTYVFAAQFSLSHACYLVAYPLAGWAGAGMGLPWVTLVLIIVGVFGTMLSIHTSLDARQFEHTEPVQTHN